MILEAVAMFLKLWTGVNWRDLVLPLCTILALAPVLPSKPATSPDPGKYRTLSSDSGIFLFDHLTPYAEGRHGSRRTTRDIEECQHTTWENRTYEEFMTSTLPPSSKDVKYKFFKYSDTTSNRRYLVGTIAYIESPYYTFSVLEPRSQGGCEMTYFSATRSTVVETAANRKYGCKLAANGGYFGMTNGKCYGNVVSDRRVVQTTNDEQNANFGIRQDGTIVVGYIPDREILNTTNPFRQLVTGVIWLVRNGTNYVNESMKLECSSHEDTGKMETFVNVISARTALGHDAEGRLVLAQVEGQTHKRGANLHEFADLLIRHGVVNAINTDGGGSNTLVEDGLVLNYPSDHCPNHPEYRCARRVSTALCVHEVECIEPDCNSHGSCDMGVCSCDSPWFGEGCEMLNCSLTNCSGRGICENGACDCDAGWTGEQCEKPCPSDYYGKGCQSRCWCHYGHSTCDPTTGCVCVPGYKGTYCWDKCDSGYYGSGCTERCPYPDCSDHGSCSPVNGSCLCEEGWCGPDCNTSILELTEQLANDVYTTDSENSTDSEKADSVNLDVSLNSSKPGSQEDSGLDRGCQGEKPTQDTTQGHSVDDGPISCPPGNNHTDLSDGTYQARKTIAIALMVSMVTLVLHVILCCLTREWAYRAARRKYEPFLPKPPPTKRKRPRRARPKFMEVPQESSSDCSL